MRVAYQAGVVRALLDHGLTFSHGDGTSGGIINLAMLYSGVPPDEMCDRWRTLDIARFVSLLPPAKYIRFLDAPAFTDADGIVEHVFPHLRIDVRRINAADGVDGAFNVCRFDDKTLASISHRDVTLAHLVAGISLPILMPIVRQGGHSYIDAVWIKDANLLGAVRRGAQELWVVWCIGNTPDYHDGVLNQYVHMIEMSAHGALFEEFDRLREINDRIRTGETVWGHTEPIRLHLIKPEYPLPLDPDLYLGRITNGTLIDMGHADAWAYLRGGYPADVPFAPAVTAMKRPKLSVTFRETMSGPFALGSTEPRAGAIAGERAGTRLALHGSISIRDLRQFVDDPNHAGELTGHIDFPPLGTALPSTRGVFNLFRSADAPDTKLMIYELGLRAQGRDLYLAGRKIVRNDRGADLWTDTTTLFTTLHDGLDATGPAIGAGVLSLGAGDLLRLTASIRVMNAQSAGERFEALTTFGRFFLGALWDQYGFRPPRFRWSRRLWQRLRRLVARR